MLQIHTRTRLLTVCAGVLACLLVTSVLAPFGSLADSKPSGKKAPIAQLSGDQRIVHVLNRLGYGPRPGDVEKVRQMGLEKYIDQQLHPEKISDTNLEARLTEFKTLTMSQGDLMEVEREGRELRQQILKAGAKPGEDGKLNTTDMSTESRKEIRKLTQEKFGDGQTKPRDIPRELMEAKLLRAVYSERQLQEVLADFWLNHFNVFVGKGLDRVFLTSYERDTIRPHVFGKFEDLLKATAESPAMMFYLDNWQSVDPNMNTKLQNLANQRRPQNPNPLGGGRFGGGGRLGGGNRFPRNPAQLERQRERQQYQLEREQAQEQKQAETAAKLKKQAQGRKLGLNENYARELMELHTLGVDGGYTQKDVTEVARCFTGWGINRPNGGMARAGFNTGTPGTFAYHEMAHDKGEKTVLGVKIGAGGGKNDGEKILHMLAQHPSTARFIATKLARRFVSDNPPQTLIDAAAETFRKTDGDLTAVYRTIFTSPQFLAKDSYRAKVKTPLELVASSLRATNANVSDARVAVVILSRLGMPLYGWQPPTGYPDTADHWVNTGALLGRLNFGIGLAGNKIPGINVSLDQLTNGETRPGAILDRLFGAFLQNDVSDQTRKTLSTQVATLGQSKPATGMNRTAPPTDDQSVMDKTARREGRRKKAEGVMETGPDDLSDLTKAGAPVTDIAQLTGLVLGSPEFQRK
ncbi:MAG: DUF1800 family protein [Blastocatellia bacterium]|nr:DUF1800 family protein [Blastocatellia bacterium]